MSNYRIGAMRCHHRYRHQRSSTWVYRNAGVLKKPPIFQPPIPMAITQTVTAGHMRLSFNCSIPKSNSPKRRPGTKRGIWIIFSIHLGKVEETKFVFTTYYPLTVVECDTGSIV